MRIQETDRILKESRYLRQSHEVHEEGWLSRVWHSVSSLPMKVGSLFKR
jgi:hypothetical protein